MTNEQIKASKYAGAKSKTTTEFFLIEAAYLEGYRERKREEGVPPCNPATTVSGEEASECLYGRNPLGDPWDDIEKIRVK